MVRTVTAFLVAACLIFAAEAKAITGNQWKRLAQAAQQAYVAGVIDAWRDVGVRAELMKKMGRAEPNINELIYTELTDCVGDKMPYGQIFAVVKKHIENNRSDWHLSMAGQVYDALTEACGFSKK
jgi:hypothetical protein